MSLLKTETAAPAKGVGLNDSLGNAQAQLQSLVEQTVSWIAHNSLQIFASVAAATVVTLALLGLRSLGRKLYREGPRGHWRRIVGRMFIKTSFWFCLMVGLKLVDGYAAAPPQIDKTINFLFTVVITFQAAVWAREFVIGMIEHRADAGDHGDTGLGSALGVIRLLVSIALFAIASVLMLDNLGVNVTGLVAGLGIGGIAIGLAAQGIFADLLAALSILIDKPFRRGDSIKWDGTSGSVEAIGLKSTRVRALSGELIVVANKQLLEKQLHNFARLGHRRNILAIGVTYQTPPEVCRSLPALIKEAVEQQEKCKFVRCGMTAFGASSLDFELQFDVYSEVYDESYNARTAVCLAILQAFNERGIEIAYPTQTTFTAAPDGRMIMPYAEPAAKRASPPTAEPVNPREPVQADA